jgi:hypothetical protein
MEYKPFFSKLINKMNSLLSDVKEPIKKTTSKTNYIIKFRLAVNNCALKNPSDAGMGYYYKLVLGGVAVSGRDEDWWLYWAGITGRW